MSSATLFVKTAKLMGSPFEIRVYRPNHLSETELAGQVELTFAEIRRIEDLLTDFRDSPFNRINDAAGKKSVVVPQEVFDLIVRAQKAAQDTNGAFDISYASVGHLWRHAFKTKTPPTREQIEKAKKYIDYRRIELKPDTLEVFLPEPEMRIGLGGIGKGYAVDRAFALLRKMSVENFIVNGAGDIRLHSNFDAPRPWRIAIRNPFADKQNAFGGLLLTNGAVATSGDYERRFQVDDKNYHHVLDGRSGEITEGICSVTILATTACEADVLATTVMVLGIEDGITHLETQRHVSGIIVTNTGEVRATKNLTNHFSKDSDASSKIFPGTAA